MVYRGKPSAGCENCRKAKKRCGLEQPSCARCVKLKKICVGYRDVSALQIQDESESVRQKVNRDRARSPILAQFGSKPAHVKLEPGAATPGSNNDPRTPYSDATSPSEGAEEVPDEYGQLISLQDTQDEEAGNWDATLDLTVPNALKSSADDLATTYFFNHFTAAQGHWTYLREMARNSSMKPVLDFAVRACGMAALNNVQGIDRGRDYARMFYGEALSKLNSSLRDPKRSKTDESLLAVVMLGYYENLTCDSKQSIQSWKNHISGAAQLLNIRGKNQFRTHIGRTLFRETRAQILIQCMWDDVTPPAFLWDLEQELEHVTSAADPASPVDAITAVTYRFAEIRAKLRLQTIPDRDAMEQLAQVETDMAQWSVDTMSGHPLWRYHDVEVPESPHVWNNLVHSYSFHPAASSWNTYRSMRIMLSRVQEMLYRRLTPNIQPEDAQIAYYKSIRRKMTDEICYGTPTQLGHASPALNSPCVLITAYSSIWPLFFAGTCTLERIGTDYFASGRSSATSAAGAQTSWVISRLEYISRNVGLHWAEGIAATLKGDFQLHGDLMDDQDKEYISFYWQQRTRREQAASNTNQAEPGANAPAWVKRIQQLGKTNDDAPQNTAVEIPRAGHVWLGRALSYGNGPFPPTQTETA